MMTKRKIIFLVFSLICCFFLGNDKIYGNNQNSGTNEYNNYNTENQISNDSITGIYILKSCENSRFKIIITEKNKIYYYTILDKKKSIAKGKAIVKNNKEYTSIMIGLIGGIFTNEDIQIQNYGNAMNEFIHFRQCDEKFLTFIKM